LEPPFKILFHYDERTRKNQGENDEGKNNVKAQIPKFNSMSNVKTLNKLLVV
jgi:hypothetical protein